MEHAPGSRSPFPNSEAGDRAGPPLDQIPVADSPSAASAKTLRAARAYAASGLLVLPLTPERKVAAIKGWPQRASNDPQKIRGWFGTEPNNIALLTGRRSGFWVLDIDPRHGGDMALQDLEEKNGPLPRTVTQHTAGGGKHLLFKMPEDGSDIRNSAGIQPGLDVRGTGGYIVVPPSVVDRREYRWADGLGPWDTEFAEAPEWLLEIVNHGSTGSKTNDPLTEGEVVPEGRNTALTSFAGTLRNVGASEVEIAAALLARNQKEYQPPLPEKEVLGIARSVSRYPSEGRSEEWTPPIPLGVCSQPAFPLEVLPMVGREFVEALAEATQTPPDLAAMLYLGGRSAALAGKLRIRINADWSQSANLYISVALPPASRKTAVFREITAPLHEFEHQEIERLRPVVAKATEHRKIKQQELEAIRKQIAAKNLEGNSIDLVRRADLLVEELATEREPRLPRFIADDVTPEALMTLLHENDGRIAVISPEGAEVFAIMKGRYTKNGMPNLGVYLNGHEGDPIHVDRRGRVESIPSPAITLVCVVQPEVIRELARHDEFRRRGLTGRFLFSLPTNTLGRRISNPKPIPASIKRAYREELLHLMGHGFPEGYEITLSPQAQECLQDLHDRLEPRLDPEVGDLAYMADWAGKLCGQTARVAGLLLADPNAGGALPVEVMKKSVRLAEQYFLPHAQAAYALMDAPSEMNDAQRLWRVIKRKGFGEFTKRDLHRSVGGQHRFCTASDLDSGLALLVDHGYIRPKDTVGQNSRRGRPPSPVYEVNPLAILEAASQ